jgi:nucleosome binding factor SPN SPT16 subunit
MLLITYSSVDIPIAEGPVNLNWGPIMKTINDSPYEFFRGGGWTFLGGTGEEVQSLLCPTSFSLLTHSRLNLLQSEQEEESETESEFEAASAQSSSKASSSDNGSDFDGSNASDDEGSGSDFDDESEGKVPP